LIAAVRRGRRPGRQGGGQGSWGGCCRERTSHHYIDLSRAWLWQHDHVKALACVVKAEQLAPQRTRYHPMARETVTGLLDAQRRMPEPLRGVAARMGLS
jgi:hypothetical protein